MRKGPGHAQGTWGGSMPCMWWGIGVVEAAPQNPTFCVCVHVCVCMCSCVHKISRYVSLPSVGWEAWPPWWVCHRSAAP